MAPIIENNYVGDGSTVLYSFTFEYIEAQDVKVSLDGVLTTGWTFANATEVELNAAPANGVAIRIYRSTTVEAVKATFYPGSAIRAQDLNENFEQVLFVVQENTVAAGDATQLSKDALATANTALSTANTSVADAAAAVVTANAADAKANTAITDSSNAVTTANAAVVIANAADLKADQAITAVAGALLYIGVNNVAAIPGSPVDGAAIEVKDSTGIESFTPLTGVPAGFVGDSGLSVRILYNGANSTWNWVSYFANNPDDRYAGLNTNAGTAALPAIAFGPTDRNTGIYSPGQDQVAVATGGTGRLFINSSGLVGIGTSTPAHYLHVSASVNDAVTNIVNTDTTNGYGLSVIAGGSASNRYIARFADAGNNAKAIILANGNVGIGTPSPSEALTVFGKVQATSEFKSETGNDLRLNAASVNRDIFMQVNGSTLMTVQGSTGNLLIGGTLPSAPNISLKADGGAKFTGGVTQTERTITAGAFNLATGNFWTCGAIAVPNPTNGVSGMSGLIRVTAAPTSFGSNFDFPGGSYTTPAAFAAIIPFYVVSSSQILLGNWTEGIA